MNNHLNISDVKNYCKILYLEQPKKYIMSYIELIQGFMLYVIENMVIQNDMYLLFLIKRGIDTITHCFKILLTYTRNLELTVFHCKKATCYYIEFIGQINDVSIHHSYLQLNSMDAALFVYKKTIYDIDNNYRKTHQLNKEEKEFFLKISSGITLFNNVILCLLQKEQLNYLNKKCTIHYAIDKSYTIINKLFESDDALKSEKLNLCLYFFQLLQQYDIDTIKYVSICEIFIKKIHKYSKKINTILPTLNNNLYNPICLDKIQELSALRFVNWTMNPL